MDHSNYLPKPNAEGKVILGLAMSAAVWFTLVYLVSANGVEFTLIGVLWELLMIPMLLILVAVPIYIIARYRKASEAARKQFALALLFWIVPFVGVVVATVKDFS